MRFAAFPSGRSASRRAVFTAAVALTAATGLLAGTAASASAMTQPATAVGAPARSAGAMTVPIHLNAYTPSALTVTVGQAVTWLNQDDVPHTVTTTSAPVKFDSGVFAKGKSFSYTFTAPGVYKYYCAVHPNMTGAITVTDKAARAVVPAKVTPPKKAAPPQGETDHKGQGDNAAPDKAQGDNAMPSMNGGDNSMPGTAHGDNSSSSTAPGTGDNSSQAGPAHAAPAAVDPVSSFMDPFMQHMQAAHFSRGVGGQVQDISELDTWAKNHEALFRRMLDFEAGSGSIAGTTQIGRVFLQHMDAAHWNRSPLGQVSDISNFDSWNKSHLAMFRIMFDDVVGKESALGKAPGTGVFMQHMDAAHWNQSLNAQGAAITDDFSNWLAGHVAMFQAMGASLSSSGGPSGH